jgi:hypothetical protein
LIQLPGKVPMIGCLLRLPIGEVFQELFAPEEVDDGHSDTEDEHSALGFGPGFEQPEWLAKQADGISPKTEISTLSGYQENGEKADKTDEELCHFTSRKE